MQKFPRTFRRDVVSRSALIPGDLNGDEWNDLFLCNPILSSCYIFYGTEEGIVNAQIGGTISGTSSSDYFGFSLAAAGEMNEDAVLDMIVCALSKKTCYVIYGGSSLPRKLLISEMKTTDGYEIVGDSSIISLVGTSVSGLGDMNGDGYDDIAVSVMTSVSSRSNVVYVIYGNGKGEGVLLSEVGNGIGGFQIIGEVGYYTGFSISGVGDVNEDGLADLAIGKLPYRVQNAQSSIIIFGSKKDGDVLLSSNIENEEVGRVLLVEGGGGFIVSGIGDINHDGIADVLLSASYDYVEASNAYIVTYPTNITSPPTLQPSSFPSADPSSLPSSTPSTFFPGHLAYKGIDRSTSPSYPTFQERKPTNSVSIAPTPISSIVPTHSPSIYGSRAPSTEEINKPSLIHSELPTYRPSISRHNDVTSHCPSSRPSGFPTSFAIDGTEVVVITAEGQYSNNSGRKEAIFDVQGRGIIEITGGNGENIYVIHSPSVFNKTELFITNFDIQRDMIDLRNVPSILTVSDISFSDNPLTMYLAKNVKFTCSSLKSIHPNQIHFIFAVYSASDSNNGGIAGSILQILSNPYILSTIGVMILCGMFVYAGWFDQQSKFSSTMVPIYEDKKENNHQEQLKDHIDDFAHSQNKSKEREYSLSTPSERNASSNGQRSPSSSSQSVYFSECSGET